MPSEVVGDDAWWFRITRAADHYLETQRDLYGYGRGLYEDFEDRVRRGERWNAALKEYKRWVLGAWEKRRAWSDAQGLVFGRDYVLPNMVEALLKKDY